MRLPQELKSAVAKFEYRGKCRDPNFCQGDCDAVSITFLESVAVRGILLAVDNPTKEPDLTWEAYGTDAVISHYMAWFPSLGVAIDWTARQFWETCDVPMVLSKEEITALWKELPFGWEDSRKYETDLPSAESYQPETG